MTSSTSRATLAASDQPEAPDRRTRHRNKRYDQVYAAAVELFIEQGYDNTTMEQIADRADVARATVFNYFARKTAFLDEWTVRRRQRAAAAARPEALRKNSLDETLKRYMMEMSRISEQTRSETVALMNACLHNLNLLANPALAAELASFVKDAQDAGEAPQHVDAHQAGVLAATSYFAVLSQWIGDDPEPFDLAAELLAMVDLVLFGISGLQSIDRSG
ncbi:TetR/AcrR family transcriptional regulator [Rhodococcus sp. NPDC057529]|uniref:TetR/AcrR family transcriptional regulator n=1 Tax=Rhodococcus sp. NPDC057529 TaxID=3346158 RepID=UPI00366CA3B0